MKKGISHTKAQQLLLIIWSVSIVLSILQIGESVWKLDQHVQGFEQSYPIQVTRTCADKFLALEMDDVAYGKLRPILLRGVSGADYCRGSYWRPMLEGYASAITALYLPILVIMIASVIKESFSSEPEPIPMQKFYFAVFGFFLAHVIILMSVRLSLSGESVFATVSLINSSIVNTLMMLAITLCFPEHRKVVESAEQVEEEK